MLFIRKIILWEHVDWASPLGLNPATSGRTKGAFVACKHFQACHVTQLPGVSATLHMGEEDPRKSSVMLQGCVGVRVGGRCRAE